MQQGIMWTNANLVYICMNALVGVDEFTQFTLEPSTHIALRWFVRSSDSHIRTYHWDIRVFYNTGFYVLWLLSSP